MQFNIMRNHSGQVINYLAAIVLLLFPALSVTVKSAASGGYGLLVLLALIYGWKGWKELESYERHVLVAFIVMLLCAVLSFVNASDLNDAWRKLGKYISCVMFIPVYLMLRRRGFNPKLYIVPGLLLGISVMAGVAIYQVLHEGEARASGVLHWIIFGDVAVLLGCLFTVFLFGLSRSWKIRIAGSFVVLLALYTVVLSGTRGAMLVIPFFIFLNVVLFRKELERVHWLMIGVLTFVIAAFSLHPDSYINKRFERGLDDVYAYLENPGDDSSWGLRLNMWRNSIKIVEDSSLLIGTGLADYENDAKALIDSGYSHTTHPVAYQHTAHSIFFHALAETGLLGLISLVAALLLFPARYFYIQFRQSTDSWSRSFALGGMVMVLSFAIFGLSETWYMRNTFMNIYLLFLLYFMLGSTHRQVEPGVQV